MTRDERLYKIAAAAIDFMSPQEAGRDIAAIINYLLKRMPIETLHESKIKVLRKINELSSADMASKKMPATASFGQAISFVKNMLSGRPGDFIESTLKYVKEYL